MTLRISEGNSFHILGKLWSGCEEENFVRARVWFAIFSRVCLTGLFGGVKYNRFWKLFGAMLYFILCMNNATLNVYWSFIVRILQNLKRGSVW